jgi:uncharacterized protein YaiE (UPF0345 family)
MSGRYNAPLGVQANAWSNATTGAGATSGALDTFNCPFVSAFGAVDGATTITLQYSQDGTHYYDGPSQTLTGAGDFRIDVLCAARYVRLKSSANVTATATLAAKG